MVSIVEGTVNGHDDRTIKVLDTKGKGKREKRKGKRRGSKGEMKAYNITETSTDRQKKHGRVGILRLVWRFLSHPERELTLFKPRGEEEVDTLRLEKGKRGQVQRPVIH
jgi:hypothetical protein